MVKNKQTNQHFRKDRNKNKNNKMRLQLLQQKDFISVELVLEHLIKQIDSV